MPCYIIRSVFYGTIMAPFLSGHFDRLTIYWLFSMTLANDELLFRALSKSSVLQIKRIIHRINISDQLW